MAATNLNAIRAVLTNCTASACIAVNPFRSKERIASTYTGSMDTFSGTFDTALDGSFGSFGWEFDTPYQNSSVCYLRAYMQAIEYPDTGGFRAVGSVNLETSSSLSVSGLRYPSAYAVTNGYVSKIKVFEICAIAEDLAIAAYDSNYVYRTCVSATNLLGGIPRLSVCDKSDVNRTSSGQAWCSYSYKNSSTYGFHGITLNKIYEVSDPSSTDDLSFTYSYPVPTLIRPTEPNVLYDYESVGFKYITREINSVIRISAFRYIVVVEWNWPPL